MLPYWLFLSLFTTGALLSSGRTEGQRGLPLGLVAAAACITVLVGMRYEVGADWEPYRLIFWQMRFVGLATGLAQSDPAFAALNWVVRKAGLGFWVVNLIGSAIYIYGLTLFAARQRHPWAAFVIAVPYLVFVVGMGYNRQAIALGFVFLALIAVSDRSFLKFMVFMMAAALFHRSAILLLPIVAMSYSKNRVVTIGLAFVATVAGYFFVVAPELDTYIDRYSGTEQGIIESSGTLVRILMNAAPALVFLALRRRFPFDKVDSVTWRNFSVLAAASLLAYAYLGPNTAIDRLAIYLGPLQIAVLGNLPYVLSREGNQSRLVVLLLIVYAAAIQIVWLSLAANAKFWIPYKFFPV